MQSGEYGPDAPTVIERVDVPSRASESTPVSDAQLRARLLPGTKVGRFRLVDALGEGGMSLVFAAHDDELDRPVALKILRTEQSDGPSRVRLLREAQALARLSHPHVVTIYEVGVWSGCVFAAMELIPGQTLREWLAASKPSMTEVLDVMIQAGRGLAAAHAAGIVHRDFKPSNVLVGSDGRTRVLDFGLAVARGERDSGPLDGVPVVRARETSSRINLLGETLTIAGTISGTPAYMAPEQLRGAVADVSADVHAFGVTLFESLCGRRPFAGRTLRERIAELDERAPLDFSGAPKLPARLRALLTRCLAVDPSERYPSMNAVLAELEQGASAKRRRVALAAGLLLATLGLGYAYGHGLDDGALQHPSDACVELAGELDEAWSEPRRQALEASFEASGFGPADAIWMRLAPQLDAYASELAAARVAACQAGARHELDEPQHAALTLCLDARARAFDRFVTALSAGEPEVVARAIPALDGLARPASCSALEPRVPATASDDPALHEQQLRLVDTLDEANLAAGLGRLDDALVMTRSLVTRAHELHWHALEAEAALLQGRVLVELGRLDEAAQVLERGLWRADRIHDDRTLGGALAALLGVAATRDDAAALRRWQPHAEVVLERLGPGGEGELELVLALALAQAQVDPGADDQAERALALAESLLDADDPARARAFERLGDVALHRGRLDVASQLYERALVVHEQVFGPEHPWMVTSLHGLARIALRRGELRRALELGERALGLAEATRMRPNAEYVALLVESGELLAALERLGEARGRLAEALVLGESLLGPTHPLTQRARHALEQLLARVAHEAASERTTTKRPPASEPPKKKKRDWFKKRKPKKKS